MLNARPDRIFISVDKSTGRSTISFAPADVGSPLLHEDDRTGAVAMREAKAISDRYPGCTIHGPHFHTARPQGRKKVFRRPPNPGTSEE
jgi:hypothetical protein